MTTLKRSLDRRSSSTRSAIIRRPPDDCHSIAAAVTLLLVLAPFQAPPLLAQSSQTGSMGPLNLSLRRAVDLALAPDGAARVALATEMIEQARLKQAETRAAFLPNLDSSVTQQNTVRNLAAFGIRLQSPVPGFALPEIVGPFNVFDARVSATQTIFNLSAIRRYQAAGSQADAARAAGADTRSQTTAAVARAYVSAQLAQRRRETAEADVALAEELVRVAEDRIRAGTGVRIESSRAQVQLADRRQAVIDWRTRSHAAQMQLARLLGVGFDRDLVLTTPLEAPAAEEMTIDAAVDEALKHRSDWQAQTLLEQAAQRSESAVKWERLPALSAFGDYGAIGSSINNSQPTRTIGAVLQVPIFDGGRRDARRAETASQARQESIRTRDMRRQIELELRLAHDSITSAALQTEVAESGLELAKDEEARAQRRYEAGVGDSIEVTDAQTRLARARQNLVDALGQYSLARIDWAEARGRVETVIP